MYFHEDQHFRGSMLWGLITIIVGAAAVVTIVSARVDSPAALLTIDAAGTKSVALPVIVQALRGPEPGATQAASELGQMESLAMETADSLATVDPAAAVRLQEQIEYWKKHGTTTVLLRGK